MARLALLLGLSGWMSLSAYGQLDGRSVPLPQTEASPANTSLRTNSPTLLPSLTSAVLPMAEAFQLTALFEGDATLVLSWTIAPDHYLYRDQFRFVDTHGETLAVALPVATTLVDEYFGETSVYFDSLQIRFPLTDIPQTADGEYLIQLGFQGCAKDRYCYPPAHEEIRLALPH